MTVELTEERLESLSAMSLEDDNVGARVFFSGVVRRMEGDETIEGLHYSSYEGMDQKILEQVEAEVHKQFPIKAILIRHRLGFVPVGERAIDIEVLSAHRKEAFAACSWAMDRIKEIVPVWKKV